MKFKLNYKQYSDFLNLTNDVFHPVKNFVTKNEFTSILKKKIFKRKFFPFPIFFGLSREQFKKIKKREYLVLVYKSKKIAKIDKLDFFHIRHDLFGKKIFGKNFINHPYYKVFKKENYIFLNFNIKKKYKKQNLLKNFTAPKVFKKKIKKIRFLPGFHTRNAPHAAHQWIHKYLFKKYKSLLIQPLIGQYKKGEYKDSYIMKTNQKAAQIIKSKKVFCLPFFSYPRYGGPSESALHAIVRKNYGCSHFWIGRDHAGYKNFYSKYQSQKFCKINKKKIGINIVSEKEPYYSKKHQCIGNDFKKISNKDRIFISGTKIRNYILKKKSIPKYMMSPEISNLLGLKSLIK